MQTVLKYGVDIDNLNDYAAMVHELNSKWWHDAEGNWIDLDKGERFMLMVTELAEGMEGARKNLQDDHLPQYPMLWVELADEVIRVLDSGHVYKWDFTVEPDYSKLVDEPKTIGAELINITNDLIFLAQFEIDGSHQYVSTAATAVIHGCVDMATRHGCTDFWQIVYAKLVYNVGRADHKLENRMLPDGKKW